MEVVVGIILIIVLYNMIDEYIKKERLKVQKEEEIKKQRAIERHNNLIKKQKEEQNRRLKEDQEIIKKIENEKIEEQKKIILLKSKKDEVYNYNKEMLINFIYENRKYWRYSFNYIPEKSTSGRHSLSVYDTKFFYIQYDYSEYSDTGATNIVDKNNGEKTNILLHGHWTDFI